MRRWQWLPVGAVAVLALSACQMRGSDRPVSSEAPPPPAFAANLPATCRAAAIRFALGRPVNGPLLEEIRVSTGARVVRTALATDAASTVGDDGRLTVDVGPDGRVVAARCG